MTLLSGYRPLVVLALLALAVAIVVARWQTGSAPNISGAQAAGCSQVAAAFHSHVSDRWVSLSARVSRLLPDDTVGLAHQRFIVRCTSGQTVLIVNDVTLGERAPVRVGEKTAIRGEYVWNSQGGLVHFTHHAQGGPGGWIEVGGRTYQ